MADEKTGAEQAIAALYGYLDLYHSRHFRLWAHDRFGTDFRQGEAHALTGLALIPEIRAALDARGAALGHTQELGRSLEQWHGHFKPNEGE